MIEIDFKIKKNEISKKILKLVKNADKVTITITYFLMPTRFLIDGVDVFYNKKYPKFGPWRDMPLVGWAAEFLAEIKTLPKKGKGEYRLLHDAYREIVFEMQKNNKVRLKQMGSTNEFIVDYDELLNAFLKFEKEVKKFLNEYAPQLKEHPYWGDWVKGKAEFVTNKGLVPIKKK